MKPALFSLGNVQHCHATGHLLSLLLRCCAVGGEVQLPRGCVCVMKWVFGVWQGVDWCQQKGAGGMFQVMTDQG